MSTSSAPGTPDAEFPWRPRLLGQPSASATRSGIATPLLAGFSITLLGVVAQQDDNFRQPGLSITLLAIAASLFIVSVQCGFWARQYLVTPSELESWHPETALNNPEYKRTRELQVRGGRAFDTWEGRARNSYGLGLLALLLGVMVALAPDSNSPQPELRWTAAAVVALMVLFELFWIVGAYLKYCSQEKGRTREPILDWWLSPVSAAEHRERRKSVGSTEVETGPAPESAG